MWCLLIVFTQFISNPPPYPLNIISSFFLFKGETGIKFYFLYITGRGGTPWSLVDFPRATPLKKMNPLFPSSYTLPIAPELEMELRVLLLWAGILSNVSLQRACDNCCEFICATSLSC